MRVYQTNEIKNIALIGSAGSGKTTLAESMLFEAGLIKRRGSIEAKNTVSDYFPVELEYGYSVFPTVFHVEWNNKKLNTRPWCSSTGSTGPKWARKTASATPRS